jgi:2-C-methyl-D-erythritol 2,4-cyclodiphosphate synthase
MRIGIGYDVHALTAGRKLMLGCVHFSESPVGLSGHSDADVVAHAVCDALLGAAGLGDIGEHFPPSDDKWKDHPGKGFLARVAAMVRERGFEIGNIDCVVMCENIRLGERKAEMATAMATALGIDAGRVNVKATTFEKHGAVGRGEIISAEAIATITG